MLLDLDILCIPERVHRQAIKVVDNVFNKRFSHCNAVLTFLACSSTGL